LRENEVRDILPKLGLLKALDVELVKGGVDVTGLVEIKYVLSEL